MPVARPRRPHLVAAAALTSGALLALTAPAPSATLTLLSQPPPADPVAPLVALLAVLAWLLTAWLTVTVGLTAGAQLPGLAGRLLAAAARRIAPRAVRRAAELALGVTVAVGALSSPATASPAAEGSAAASLSVPSLDWGAPPPAPLAASPGLQVVPPAASPASSVVVRPGDTLWALAAQELAARATAPPTDAQVAQRWPAWWAANRDAVGSDPHHITPGLHLSAPAA